MKGSHLVFYLWIGMKTNDKTRPFTLYLASSRSRSSGSDVTVRSQDLTLKKNRDSSVRALLPSLRSHDLSLFVGLT